MPGPLRLERFETTLRDGTPVLVRPVRPTDKDLLRRGFERLSETSRVRRFMTPLGELPEEQVRYLTEIDYIDHFAWAAVRADRPEEGLGVARYVRLEEDPRIAEAAVTVVDEYHGRGLGTLLLALLALAARAAGITTFRGFVLEENAPMQEVVRALGVEARHVEPGVVQLDVPLDAGLLPDSPLKRVFDDVERQVREARRRARRKRPAGPGGSARRPQETP